MSDFEKLTGHKIIAILDEHCKPELPSGDVIWFVTKDTNNVTNFLKLYHHQDCCEDVRIEDICGDLMAMVGETILLAEEVADVGPETSTSSTWTFYKLSTNKESVTIRWLGESNGYYSEDVDIDYYSSPQALLKTIEVLAGYITDNKQPPPWLQWQVENVCDLLAAAGEFKKKDLTNDKILGMIQ